MPISVLVVGGGGGLPRRLRLARPGLRTSALCSSVTLPRMKAPGEHQAVLALGDEATTDDWISAARYLDTAGRFDALACFGERDQDRAASVADALGLEWHTPATMHLVSDKAAMRERLRECRLDDTPSAVVHDGPEGIRAFLRQHGGPAIVKPVDSTGSIGVTRVEDPRDAETALRRAADNRGWGRGGILVEGFLDGPQISVESFTSAGRHHVVGVTRKYSTADGFVEIGHVCPAPLEAAVARDVQALVPRVLDALGVTFGPTHTELVVTEAGPRVLETHTRLAGDDIPLLVQDATGVDLEQLTIDQVGRYSSPNPEPAKPREREPSAIWFLGCRVDGTVVSVTGLDLCRASNGVHEASVSVCPGDLVRRLGASQDRIGMVRARGTTAEAALDNARRAAGLIEIAVDARLDTDLAIV